MRLRPLREKDLEFAEDCATLANFFAEDLAEAQFEAICARYWERVSYIKRAEGIRRIAARLRREIPKSTEWTPRQKDLRLSKADETAAREWDRQQTAFVESLTANAMHQKLNAIGDFMRKEVLPRCAPADHAAPHGFMVLTDDGDRVARVFPKDAGEGRFVFIEGDTGPLGEARPGTIPLMPFHFIDERPNPELKIIFSLHDEAPAQSIAYLFAAARYWPFRVCRWQGCQTGSRGTDAPTLFVPLNYSDNPSCSPKCRDAFLHWARSNPDREEYDPEYVQKRREAASRQRERKRLANVAAGTSRKRRKKTIRKTSKTERSK